MTIAHAPAFEIHPVTVALGAEIRGQSLCAPLVAGLADELRAALAEHLVLFSAINI